MIYGSLHRTRRTGGLQGKRWEIWFAEAGGLRLGGGGQKGSEVRSDILLVLCPGANGMCRVEVEVFYTPEEA